MEQKEPTKRPKYGGRQKGSVNKVTAVQKEIITELLSDYQSSGMLSKDFLALKPKDRIQCAEKLMQYVIPKMQSVAFDADAATTKITIESKLRELAKDPDDI